MRIKYGNGKTGFGHGVEIVLTGGEVAIAIDNYLYCKGVFIDGARTITVNAGLCESGKVYVDPSGSVVAKGKILRGRGKRNA